MSLNRKLRMALIGGGPGAFIGDVHSKAARMDGKIELVAGVFGFPSISLPAYGSRPAIVILPGAGAREGRQVRFQSLHTSWLRKRVRYFSSMMFCKVACQISSPAMPAGLWWWWN